MSTPASGNHSRSGSAAGAAGEPGFWVNDYDVSGDLVVWEGDDGNDREIFLYDAASDGVPLWEELWTGANAVQVSDGLFNVMLGSLTPIDAAIISANDTLWLGITAGTDDEMSPRV